MRKTFHVGGTIAASGSSPSAGTINLVRTRTLSVTASAKFHGSATGDVRVDLFYSPNGNDWDTMAYATFDLTVSQGNRVQKTAVIDPPEHGYMSVTLTNEDATYAVADHKIWYSVQVYPPYERWEKEAKGEITTPAGG